jgi:radical SAM-linked protein
MDKIKIKIVLNKIGEMKYFSQLDLSRVLERALRRGRLPVWLTQGFNPRIKMSFSRALKVGIEGEQEVIVYFVEEMSTERIKETLIPQLPAGFDLITVEKV